MLIIIGVRVVVVIFIIYNISYIIYHISYIYNIYIYVHMILLGLLGNGETNRTDQSMEYLSEQRQGIHGFREYPWVCSYR
jgi:hypothetical protein